MLTPGNLATSHPSCLSLLISIIYVQRKAFRPGLLLCPETGTERGVDWSLRGNNGEAGWLPMAAHY
jgi:hypothetical protein